MEQRITLDQELDLMRKFVREFQLARKLNDKARLNMLNRVALRLDRYWTQIDEFAFIAEER